MSFARAMALLAMCAPAGCGSEHVDRVAPAPRVKHVDLEATAARLAIPRGTGNLAAMAPRRGLTLRDAPGGNVIAHLKPRTAWGSPTVVSVIRRQGRWLGVVATSLRNHQIGWLDVLRDHPRMWRTPLSLHADLSARTLELRRGARVVRRMSVGIGGPDTPTPVGRFSVTDKLIPGRGVSYYGCCLLALSGHQAHLRPGWAGGDRIAIHGGRTGGAASAGCLHASDADLKRLMRVVPIGTPVYISG
jgi:hypothetical protein